MTTQTRRFIELKDILALRFDCRKCGASISVPMGDCHRIPSACSNCLGDFTNGFGGDSTGKVLGEFANSLKHVVRLVDDRPFVFSLEIVAENEKAKA